MLSIILITFIILMVMNRNFDIDLDIKGLESFDPISMEEVVEVKVEDEEVVEDDYYSGYFQTKRLLTFEEAFDKMQRKYSKRGKHGHKGYTRVQTLAYKKAREFKIAHLNEWC